VNVSKVLLFFQIWRVILSFWEPQDPKQYSIENGFPGFILYQGEHIYGFPVFEYPGLVKVCAAMGLHCGLAEPG
jgi:hypothetical protein